MKLQGSIISRPLIAPVTGLALVWLVTPIPAVAQNAYITNQGIYPNFSNKVTVIDTTTNKVVTTIDVGLAPAGVAVTPDGGKVYVANEAVKGTVSVIDTATNAVSAIANEFDHTVSVIATASNTVVATIDVGTSPVAFGIFILPRSRSAPVR
jgi:YVTN family beta-propeller protein